MEPLVQQNSSEVWAKPAVGAIKHDQREVGRVTEKMNVPAGDLADPWVEVGRCVAEVEAANKPQVRRFAEELERFAGIDAFVIGRLRRNFDFGLAVGDARYPHL